MAIPKVCITCGTAIVSDSAMGWVGSFCPQCNDFSQFNFSQARANGDRLLKPPLNSGLDIRQLPDNTIQVISDPYGKWASYIMLAFSVLFVGAPLWAAIYLWIKGLWLISVFVLLFGIPFSIISFVLNGIIYAILFKKQTIKISPAGITIESKYGFFTKRKIFKNDEISDIKFIQFKYPRHRESYVRKQRATYYIPREEMCPTLFTTHESTVSITRTHQLLQYDDYNDQLWFIAQVRYTLQMD